LLLARLRWPCCFDEGTGWDGVHAKRPLSGQRVLTLAFDPSGSETQVWLLKDNRPEDGELDWRQLNQPTPKGEVARLTDLKNGWVSEEEALELVRKHGARVGG